jgi:hypothetical protein
MTREELEHIIRASADITDQYEFVIVGSQCILGPIPHPEAVFTMSAEADIYPLQAPELAEKIDGAIGEGSPFHQTHGYYAQGVGPDTAILPNDWMPECTASRTRTRTRGWPTASMWWISFFPRRRQGATKIASSAWR